MPTPADVAPLRLVRRTLLVLAAIALAWGAGVVATGGVEIKIAGVWLRSRAPDRALLIGFALLVAQALLFRDAFARDVGRIETVARRFLVALVIACALALGVFAVYYGTFVAGGADSWGYVSQAYSWANGTLPHAQPFAIALPWPSADASLAPLGYRPGTIPHTMVPTYAPGLPLMMAASLLAGSCGPFLVVPLCAVLVVWLTFVLGRRAAGPWVGLLAAILAATSPIVLFQSLWPMSDVPSAALWTGAAGAALGERRRDVVLCGLLSAAGLLVRPNLPVVPLVLLAHVALSAGGRERWTRVAMLVLPAAVVAGSIAVLYTAWYGAPWQSGYGAAGQLFSLSTVGPNLRRYPVWLWRSQSPLVILAIVPLLPPFNRHGSRPAVRLCGGLFAATLASYLVYFQFEEWWYLRFLLPAIPALLVLQAVAFVSIGRRLPRLWGRLLVAALTVITVVATARFSAVAVGAGNIQAGQGRYSAVGAFVGESLPPDAVVLSVQESGSVRYYGGRLTIRWDLIDRDWTGRAAAELEHLGLHPYLVIEDFELPQFREWFGLPKDAALPWPLAGRMRAGEVSVLDLASHPQARPPVSIEPGGRPSCQAPRPLVVRPR